MPRDSTISDFSLDERQLKNTPQASVGFRFYKRSIDISTSLILLPILAIICFLALILYPFLNSGRLFYVQTRVGKNNVEFQIFKFRTIQNEVGKTKFATKENARITPLGKFMRDIHVDELPQIVNVLLGDMSLIGPRPEQSEFFQKYVQSIQGFTIRQSVRPGISGLAQLRYGYTDCTVGARRKLKWDLEYIRCQGFGLESMIYLQTFVYVFQRIGRRLINLIKPNVKG